MNHKPGGIYELLRVAIPLVVSMASFQVMQFVNRLFLAWYSPDALAAQVPAGIFSFSIICFFMGVASYTNVLVAQHFGRGQRNEMTQSAWQGIWFSLLAWGVIVAMVPVGRWVIASSGHAPEVKPLELEYFTILTLGGGLPVLCNALAGYFTGQGRTRITMAVNLLGNAVNVALSYVLTLGLGPVPAFGLRGAGCAIIASNTLMVVVYFAMFLRPSEREANGTWRFKAFARSRFKDLMRFGLPNGVGFLLDIASFSLFMFLIGNLGKAAQTASNITLSLEGLSFMPVLGIGTACSTLVGQYIGKRDLEAAGRVPYRCLMLTVGYATGIGLLYVLFPGFFVGLFTMRHATEFNSVFLETAPLLKVLVFFILADAINVTFGQAIKGAGDTKFHMIVSVACAWLFFAPGTIVLLTVLKWPVAYAWTWATVYVLLLAFFFFVRFRSGKWRQIEMIR